MEVSYVSYLCASLESVLFSGRLEYVGKNVSYKRQIQIASYERNLSELDGELVHARSDLH